MDNQCARVVHVTEKGKIKLCSCSMIVSSQSQYVIPSYTISEANYKDISMAVSLIHENCLIQREFRIGGDIFIVSIVRGEGAEVQ